MNTAEDTDKPNSQSTAGDQPTSRASTAPDHLRCTACGYDLRGLPAQRDCPECGKPVTESRRELTAGQARFLKATRVAAVLVLINMLAHLHRWRYPLVSWLEDSGIYMKVLLGWAGGLISDEHAMRVEVVTLILAALVWRWGGRWRSRRTNGAILAFAVTLALGQLALEVWTLCWRLAESSQRRDFSLLWALSRHPGIWLSSLGRAGLYALLPWYVLSQLRTAGARGWLARLLAAAGVLLAWHALLLTLAVAEGVLEDVGLIERLAWSRLTPILRWWGDYLWWPQAIIWGVAAVWLLRWSHQQLHQQPTEGGKA